MLLMIWMFYNHPNIVNAYHDDQTLISLPEYHQIIIEENEEDSKNEIGHIRYYLAPKIDDNE